MKPTGGAWSRRRENFFWSATRSNRFINSGAPISCSTAGCATTLRDRGVGFVKLTRSFRSVRNIQQFVNAAFETEMTGDVESGQADWAPLEEDRADADGRPSVIVLPVPAPL